MSFVSSSNADSGGSTTNTLSPAAPAGLVAGHMIEAEWNNGGVAGSPITWPAGFTEYADASHNGSGGYDGPYTHKKAWKLAGAGEPANYTITSGTNDFCTCVISCYAGRDPAGPTAQVSNGLTNDASPITVGATGMTALDGADISWSVCGQPSGSNIYTYTPPTNYIEREDVHATFYQSTSLATRDNVSAGATGTLSGTATGSNSGGWSAIVSHFPAAPASAPLSLPNLGTGIYPQAISGFAA